MEVDNIEPVDEDDFKNRSGNKHQTDPYKIENLSQINKETKPSENKIAERDRLVIGLKK